MKGIISNSQEFAKRQLEMILEFLVTIPVETLWRQLMDQWILWLLRRYRGTEGWRMEGARHTTSGIGCSLGWRWEERDAVRSSV